MEKQQRIEKIRIWLREITAIEEQKEATVGWLIEKAAEDPIYLARAGKNVWRAIQKAMPDGSVPIPLRNLPAPRNRLYEDQPDRMRMYPLWNDFFDVEETIAHIGNFFENANMGHEEERQALWLWGPAGSGKTSFVRKLCEELEDFTFWAVRGCPYHEHPLHMVPRRQRAVLFEVFYPFEGSPCPDCWRRLQKDIPYNNRWWEMPVEDLHYSEGAACGIAFKDHRVADQTDKSLPEEWIQILQREANGGLLVVQCTKEMQPAAFMELVGEVVQSGRMNIKESAARVSLDVAVIFLANVSFSEYKSGDTALKSRVQEYVLPYVVSPHAEKQVVAKINRYLAPAYHFMPCVEDALDVIVCASRLREPKKSLDAPALLKRLRLYAGEFVEDESAVVLPIRRTRKEMRIEFSQDGIYSGMSVRSALKLRSAAGGLCEGGCVTIQDVLVTAAKQLDEENFSGDANTFPREFLKVIDFEAGGKKLQMTKLEELLYQKTVLNDLVHALVGPERFDKKVEDLKEQYLDHASAYVNKREFIDDKGEVPTDEAFLKKVEKFAGVEDKDRQDTFRREVCQYFSERQRKGEVVSLTDIPKFQNALWKHEASTPLNEICVAYELLPGTRDPIKERKRIETLKTNLGKMGYKPCCIQKLLGDGRTSGYIRRMNLNL